MKTDWINTLSYLLPMKADDELTNWIVDNAPDKILHFEIDKFSAEQRFKIFKSILENCKDKNIWFPYYRDDLDKFIECFSSKEAIEYLLEEISNPAHECSLFNALGVLFQFDELYGLKANVKEALLLCCATTNTSPEEKRSALYALGKHNINDKETTIKLFELFNETKNTREQAGMYYYLTMTNQVDERIDFFLKNITSCFNREDEYYISMKIMFIAGLKTVSSINGIKHLFYAYSQDGKNDYEYEDDFKEIAEEMVQKAVKYYNDGEINIYDCVQNALVNSLNAYRRNTALLWQFFIETGTQNMFFKYLNDTNDITKELWNLSTLTGDDYLDFLASIYSKGKGSKDFIDAVSYLPESHPSFTKYQSLIKEKDNILVEPFKPIDRDKIRKEGEQRYFKALFNKEEYIGLVDELAVFINNGDLTCKKINELKYKDIAERYDLETVKWDLKRLCHDEDCCKPVKIHLNQVDWDFYFIHKIYNCIKSDKRDKYIISEEQKRHIEKYCAQVVTKIDFSSCVDYNEDGSYTCSWESVHLAFFIPYFDLDFGDEVLLDLLCYPYLYEIDNKNVLSLGHDYSFSFIEKKLQKKEILNRVIINVTEVDLSGEVLARHLKYCKVNKIEQAAPIAVRTCINEKFDNYIKFSAFDYLSAVMGEEYIYENILNDTNDYLLSQVALKYAESGDERLIKKILEERQKHAASSTKFLHELLLLQSTEGLNIYYDLASKSRMIPDYSNNGICSLTESVAKITNPSFLPQLLKLVTLRFSVDFLDSKYIGLSHSLLKSLIKIGSEGNSEAVITGLKYMMNTNQENGNLKRFGNIIINDLKGLAKPLATDMAGVKKVLKELSQ